MDRFGNRSKPGKGMSARGRPANGKKYLPRRSGTFYPWEPEEITESPAIENAIPLEKWPIPG
jgi:hypothetical protein